MAKRFFSVRLPIFGSVAMLLLCVVFFLLPFALRGAKLGLKDMQNNVADWLPDHYIETQELKEFAQYFDGGAQFVVLSGPWCKEGDPRFTNLKRKIFEESLEYEKVLKEAQNEEEIVAHRKGDELALMFAGNYLEDWGEQREKWLMGRKSQWYFLNRKGHLYRWKGQNNVVDGAKRTLERSLSGKNKADGTFIHRFGAPPDDVHGIENPFYKDPQLLCCRPFKSVISGPDILKQMAGPDGSLVIGSSDEDSLTAFEAKIEAHKRLTGALFGPVPSHSFNWTFDSLLSLSLDEVSQAKSVQLRSDERYRQRFDDYISREVNENFGGDIANLISAKSTAKLEVWYNLWFQMEIEPPPRQTCLIVTLNEPVIQELARAVGRPILGKPRGRLLELATGECGIEPENLHIGGPPVDNVAIDEEGTSTLLKLVSLSLGIGLTLAYMSFGSIRIAIMLFFVGGVSAISSLAYVWFAGQTMDAILMSMPSLVYVLGLSAAVHIVNYYRDACYEDGPDLAAETAVRHSWFPCTLAAFTTALGLISLTTSNLTPIYKFGLFSAIATMATVLLLFAYLPSALTVWKPGYTKRTREERNRESNLTAAVTRMWSSIGDWVIDHHLVVTTVGVGMLIFFAVGISRVETSVQLLKLFDSKAKILSDYRWMEENLGELVPAEIAVQFELDSQMEPFEEAKLASIQAAELAKHPAGTTVEQAMKGVDLNFDDQYRMEYDLKYSMLERIELSRRIRQQLERFFGPDGMGIVGSGMSMDVFTPLYTIEDQEKSRKRRTFSQALYSKRSQMLEEDYLAVVGESETGGRQAEPGSNEKENIGLEMWRISIRLAALSNVDYGQFVNDLKAVVEPILTAYRFRTDILKGLQAKLGPTSLTECRVLILGRNPDRAVDTTSEMAETDASVSDLIDQTFIFSDTLKDLLENRGITSGGGKRNKKRFVWIDPDKLPAGFGPEKLKEIIGGFDCVVFIEDANGFDPGVIGAETRTDPNEEGFPVLIDCREHQFKINPRTKLPMPGMLTAKEIKASSEQGEDIQITTMYTGIVPIVYKAQRSLLHSLVKSIGLAFVMISGVMMLLLRDWRSPVGPSNLLNIRGGLVSMLPNVFPVVIVFGFMGHMNGWYRGTVDGFLIDIGSMMTASVAMGVAVDDTIHFLTWYRTALAKGLSRKSAIREAYSRVATAMTQTTLIGGLGLSAFALSTFTPTQRFGVLMLVLLVMALVGDLILLPALLAGPLGKYFGKELPQEIAANRGEVSAEMTLRLIGDHAGEPVKPDVIGPSESDLSKDLRRLE